MTVIIRRKNFIKKRHIQDFVQIYILAESCECSGRSASEFLIPMSEINDIAAVNSRWKF